MQNAFSIKTLNVFHFEQLCVMLHKRLHAVAIMDNFLERTSSFKNIFFFFFWQTSDDDDEVDVHLHRAMKHQSAINKFFSLSTRLLCFCSDAD
jgi:hypothetical protein